MTLEEAQRAMCEAINDIRAMDASRATRCPTWSPTAIRDAAALFRSALEIWYGAAMDADAPDCEHDVVLQWDDEVSRHMRQADLAAMDAAIYGVGEC